MVENKISIYHYVRYDLSNITNRNPSYGTASMDRIEYQGSPSRSVLYEIEVEGSPIRLWLINGSIVGRMQSSDNPPIEGPFTIREAASFAADVYYCKECDSGFLTPQIIRGVSNGCGDDSWGEDEICPKCGTTIYFN